MNEDRLRGLMANSELFFERIRHGTIFNHEDETAKGAGMLQQKRFHLIIRIGTSRTLRAMLENHNGFFL